MGDDLPRIKTQTLLLLVISSEIILAINVFQQETSGKHMFESNQHGHILILHPIHGWNPPTIAE